MKTTIKSVYLTFAAIALLVCFALSPGAQGAPPEPAKVDKATRVRISGSYGKLPLSFEANEGQQDGQVKFLSRGSGYNLFLTNREAVLVLTKPEKALMPPANKATLSQKKPKRQSTVLRTQLIAANPAGKVTGEVELPGKVNYFIGHDPAKWRSDVATYAKVRYEQVYPGIDLLYYGNQGQLEYDFVVGPGADPARIRLRVAGARKMYVDGQGQLVVQTAGGAVRWNKPEIYQEVDGQHRSVKGKYVLRRGHELGFEVAAYDTARPLIIDPILVYSTYLGGSGGDYGQGIAVDTSGNAYVTGNTFSSDFPITPGAFQTTYGGGDAFVTQLNPTGSSLVYSTYLGGSISGDRGLGIAVDTSGNAYVTGTTFSNDFPTTPGAFQTTYAGGLEAFVTKLNPTGSALVYSTYLGGSGDDEGQGLAVDTSGNAYVTGYTTGLGFPTTPGAFQTTYGGGTYGDAFVTELNPTGTDLLYSTYLGGSNTDLGYGIAVDTSGNAYVTGYMSSNDFPTTPGAFQTTCGDPNCTDAFVTELNPTGSALVYSTYLGGRFSETGYSIAVDTSGNAYVTGQTNSSDFPTTPGAFQTTFGGGSWDAFVTELNPTGTDLLYSTYLGGSGGDQGYGIALDTSGNAYLTGETGSSNFPTTPGAFQTTYGGSTGAYVTKLNPTGSALVYSTYLGGTLSDHGYGIAVDTSGNAYVTGYTIGRFPITPGAFQTTFGGRFDAFVTELNSTGTDLVYSTYLGGGEDGEDDYGYGITVDTSGNAYVTGSTSSSDFPTTPGAFQTTKNGDTLEFDAFMTELNPTGTGLLYSTYLGGSDSDGGRGIAVDSSGNAYVTGSTGSSNFPTTLGAFQTTHGGSSDAFVAKIDTVQIGIVLTASRRRTEGEVLVHLAWTGATSPKVDIYRDGVRIARVPNSGRYEDLLTVRALYTYQVCEAREINCSNQVTVRGPP